MDLLWAAICLSALLLSLIGLLEIWAWLLPNTLTFSWSGYLQTIQADPNSGKALYLMIGTTLIPTIVHVVASLGAIVTQKSHLLNKVADTSQTKLDSGADLTAYDQRALLGREFRAQAGGLFSAFAATALLSLGLWHGSGWIWSVVT